MSSELPEESVPNGSWSVQDLGHRSHEAVGQQGQFGAAIWPLHYSETGRKSLVRHWRSHQTELPRVLMNSGSPWSNPIQTQEQQILKVNCKKHILVLKPMTSKFTYLLELKLAQVKPTAI